VGRVNLKAGDEQIESWKAAAEREQLSLSAWARRVLSASAEQAGRGEAVAVGEAAVRAVPPAEPEPPAAEAPVHDTPESVAVKAQQARAIMDRAQETFRPDPKQKPRLSQVLGGTVSAPQSVKAMEAQRLKQARDEAFSMVCPKRAEHTPGVRCPLCHGIA